ncbi:unnamed protein product, partial [Closterium sp. NIES-64]
VWEREVEHVSGGELQRFAVGVVGGQLGDRHLHVWEREVEHLSGGELQRFAIGVVAGQLGDIYMFDEPSSYLDVRQRLKAAQVIRSLLAPDRYVIVVERDLSVLDYLSHFMCCLYGKPGAYRAVFLRYHPMQPTACPLTPHSIIPIPPRYVIVVEHDLSVLDYLSDFICCLYGKPGAYGVVTLPFSVREGINIFLAGFVPTENLRFRDESLTFRVSLPIQSAVRGGINIFLAGFVLTENLRFRDEPLTFRGTKTPVDILRREAKTYSRFEAKTYTRYKYPRMVKKQGGFKLTVEPGDFTDSQIVVMLGENGTGKTTFIRMLVGKLSLMGAHAACTSLWLSLLPVPSMIHLPSLLSPFQAALSRPDPDEETGKEAQGDRKEAEDLPEFNVSYKPQKISPKFPHSVRALLHSKIRDSFHHPQFNTDVLRPMQIDPLLDQEVVNLSGGELQRVAITLCLGKPADIYLIDEPSAYLDSRAAHRDGQGHQAVHPAHAFLLLVSSQPADIYLIDEPSAYLDSEQRIVAAKPADIYLIDEPSAYLDSEQRIVAAKVIKRFILHAKKTAFVVEHDFIMATYLADRVIVYEGQPSVDCTARTPQSLNSGMNLFLSQLDITFRRDPTNFRPRINKMDSVKDREQKNAGTYYYLDD